jgi:hypothetical protein
VDGVRRLSRAAASVLDGGTRTGLRPSAI